MTSWGVAEAKAKLSEVLDRAETEGPQLVKRRKQRFVLLTEEQLIAQRSAELAGKARVPAQSAWDALRPPPELCFDYDFPRLKGKARPAKL